MMRTLKLRNPAAGHKSEIASPFEGAERGSRRPCGSMQRSIADASVLREILFSTLVKGETPKAVADRLGLNPPLVGRIRNGKNYSKERLEIIKTMRAEGHNVDLSRCK